MLAAIILALSWHIAASVDHGLSVSAPLLVTCLVCGSLVEGHAPSSSFEAQISFSVAPRSAPAGTKSDSAGGPEDGSTSGEAEGDSDGGTPKGQGSDSWDEVSCLATSS